MPLADSLKKGVDLLSPIWHNVNMATGGIMDNATMRKRIINSLKRTHIGTSKFVMGIRITKLSANAFRVSTLGTFDLDTTARITNLEGF